MRKASFGPAAVGLATLLTVFASVGLHPEPADAGLASGTGPHVLQTSGNAVQSAGSHDCQICLAHRTVPLTSLSDVIFERESAVFSPVGRIPSARGLALPLLSDGRAPPSA